MTAAEIVNSIFDHTDISGQAINIESALNPFDELNALLDTWDPQGIPAMAWQDNGHTFYELWPPEFKRFNEIREDYVVIEEIWSLKGERS